MSGSATEPELPEEGEDQWTDTIRELTANLQATRAELTELRGAGGADREKLGRVEAELAEARAELAGALARLEAMQSTPPPSPPPPNPDPAPPSPPAPPAPPARRQTRTGRDWL